MTSPFARTTCACAACVACCKQQPGSLGPGDFERIAAFLGEQPGVAALHFWASPGAIVGRLNADGNIETARVGTITPKLIDGRCTFLNEHDRCTVHAVAPFGCAYFDTHMSVEEGQRRGAWHVAAIAGDLTYRALRACLSIATSYAPRRAL